MRIYYKKYFKNWRMLLMVATLGFFVSPFVSYADINSGLVSHWKFDEGTGTTVADSSGQGNTGTVTSPSWITGTGMKIGTGALTFNGSGTQVTTTNFISSPQTFTMAFWFKTTSASGRKMFGFENNQIGTNSSLYDRQVWIGPDGKIRFSRPLLVSNNVLNNGQWHHVVVTHNGTTGKLYVNGILQGSGNMAPLSMNGYWRMGGYKMAFVDPATAGDGYFNGSLDDVRLYNRVLSDPDVTELFAYTGVIPNAGKTSYEVKIGTTERISEHNVCYDVTNNSGTGLSVFVPTKTAAEWASFYSYPPQGVSLVLCGGTPLPPPVQSGAWVAPTCPTACGYPGGPMSYTCSPAGTCSTPQPPDVNCPATGSCIQLCVPTWGLPCTSASNMCGMRNPGTIQCNGSCGATIPSNTLCPAVVYGCTDPLATNYNSNANSDDGSCVYGPSCLTAGQPCTSASNACGATSSGTIDPVTCTCNANPPPTPANLGNTCTSSSNNCGDTNQGTIQCNGSCNASQPANRADCGVCLTAGQPCTSASNACGATSSGTIDPATCTCNANPPATPANLGGVCNSTQNACNQTGQGTIQCDGSCSGVAPAVPANLGGQCFTAQNACGIRGQGTIQCDGLCNATMVAVPSNYGNPCVSAQNNCGATNPGTIGCDGTCQATPPTDVPNVGSNCQSGPNNCGDRGSGSFQCDGTCNATQPADVPNVGNSCTSAPNNCNDTSQGTIQCDGSCDAVTPPNRVCGVDIPGCMDPMANNYNSSANRDDGSCDYDIYGCTNPSATNYNSFATVDDGSCIFACLPQTCSGPSYFDDVTCSCQCAPFYHDENGTCVADSIDPCDPFSPYYNPFEPTCGGDICLTIPDHPTCPCPNPDEVRDAGGNCVIDCFMFPESCVQVIPCEYYEVRMPDGTCMTDCIAYPDQCQQACLVGDKECLCISAGREWDGNMCCDYIDPAYGFCL